LVTDPVQDDQSLVVKTRQGLLVVLGCAHAGVVNTLNYVLEQTGLSRIHTLIGGTHLKPANAEQVAKTVEALLAFDIKRVGVAHCTGQEAAVRIAQAFDDRFFFCNVGCEIEI
jgi:7,8-dihydropterin-6-yl-methyl-4-(beta-D-ribofuranosyl)aminobenzene 5'-phosphate synthase